MTYQFIDMDDLAVLGEAATIMARLRAESIEPALVREAANLGFVAIELLLDYVLRHPERVSPQALS